MSLENQSKDIIPKFPWGEYQFKFSILPTARQPHTHQHHLLPSPSAASRTATAPIRISWQTLVRPTIDIDGPPLPYMLGRKE